MPRVAWEGGPSYWSKFPKAAAGGWTDPGFFPILVWYESPGNSAALKALGINTMIPNHDGSNIQQIGADTGMSFIAGQEFTAAEVGTSNKVVGWEMLDECDMLCADPPNDLKKAVDANRAKNDGRFMYANFGKGVLGNFWNPENLPGMAQMLDAASADLYFYTDPNFPNGQEVTGSDAWPPGATIRSSSSYGWTVRRMRSFLDPAAMHPTWNFVEVGHPWSEGEAEAPTMRPEWMEGAVWASIVNEARGIQYFNHSFGGSCQSQHVLFDCNPAMKDRVAAVNAKIAGLAPVLNTQSYVWDTRSGNDTMLKTHAGSAYLFATLAQNQSTGTKTFTLPAGITGTTVTVIGENRTLPVTGATFSDTFAQEYTHHIYKITL